MTKGFEELNGMIEQYVTNEQQKYRQKMGRDMTSVELYAFTAGIYEGFFLALEWADKPTSTSTSKE